MTMQNTIKDTISIEGIGIHSGEKSTLRLVPAAENHGVKFLRTDINALIECNYKNVVPSPLCTMVIDQNSKGQVSTIEHLLSALWAAKIDNILIEIDNEEVPILDGSSVQFYKILTEIGAKMQASPRKYIRVKKKVEVVQDDKFLSIAPAEALGLDVTIDFAHPIVGRQHLSFKANDNYLDVASARTFGFEQELEYLHTIGKGKGVSIENAVGLTPEGLSEGVVLRFQDEFVRHKTLDLLGDLYVGGNGSNFIIGEVKAYKMGHRLNNALLHKLFSDNSNYEIT